VPITPRRSMSGFQEQANKIRPVSSYNPNPLEIIAHRLSPFP
jgi:hypothetical protein